MRTTTAVAIAAAATAATAATPAGAATAAPTAHAKQCSSGEPVRAAVFLQLSKNSYAKTTPSYVSYVDADMGCKGAISLQHRSGPHVKLRVISCAKKPKVLSDWMLPPHSTHTYTGVKRNNRVALFSRGTCFRVQGWKGKGVTRGGASF
ncbi:hypothetical protein GCM10023196_100890 [Actinoallomurus vinaceus]|uniref:Secreted protein n=2 Tax=Actinoallomurus vinaceus TaxID=1080074 RepID=A0ABP8USX8_9ACTN